DAPDAVGIGRIRVARSAHQFFDRHRAPRMPIGVPFTVRHFAERVDVLRGQLGALRGLHAVRGHEGLLDEVVEVVDLYSLRIAYRARLRFSPNRIVGRELRLTGGRGDR